MSTLDPGRALSDAPATRVRFERSGVGVTVVDPIQRSRDAIAVEPADAPVRPVDPDRMTAPVTAAVSVAADELVFSRKRLVYVWDGDWTTLDRLMEGADRTFEDGEYVLSVAGAIKLYVEVEGSVRVRENEETHLSFGDGATVRIGGRSNHERPAGTVTTTTDPEDVMAAVSTFGSALKTTTPERSWPSMRGHPPSVELGDALDVPPGLHPPDEGVWIEVPRTLRHAYVVAPLAYYLGATVVPGPTPRVVTDDGFAHDLAGDRGFEEAVERTLKQVVFLECLARNEGIYEFPLVEERDLDPDLAGEVRDLYDVPSGPRLARMLSIPYGRIVDHLPDWELCTYVDPDPKWAALIPHLVNDMALVKTTASVVPATVDDSPDQAVEEQSEAVDGFLRSAGDDVPGTVADDVVALPDDPVLERSYAGAGRPYGGSKAVVAAYRNRLDREPADPPIDVAVVCNDRRMLAELDGAENYATDGTFPFDVSVYRDLSTAALSTLLEAGDAEFLHYIGHATEEGIECSDGSLDVRDLSTVAVDSFLLNACDSYEQGLGLIERGAVGGVVTREEVPNEVALDVGRFLARLLNIGVSLRSAMDLVRRRNLVGDRYLVVGDGGVSVGLSRDTCRSAFRIRESGPGEFEVQFVPLGTQNSGIGTVTRPFIDSADYQMFGNDSEWFAVDREELAELLDGEEFPVETDDGWFWNGEVDLLNE